MPELNEEEKGAITGVTAAGNRTTYKLLTPSDRSEAVAKIQQLQTASILNNLESSAVMCVTVASEVVQ